MMAQPASFDELEFDADAAFEAYLTPNDLPELPCANCGKAPSSRLCGRTGGCAAAGIASGARAANAALGGGKGAAEGECVSTTERQREVLFTPTKNERFCPNRSQHEPIELCPLRF